ncbi:ISL3 family transposase [Staphylococcus haemolyticus]|nr:ISL3 family transposase [Staphylococcus haemolyticus]
MRLCVSIKDKNLNFSDEVIEKKHKGRMSLFYYAELTYQPTHCENCSTKNENFSIVKNGKKTSTITLLKIMEMPAYLELQKQRFYCKSCDSHFTAKSNIVDAHCFISNKTKLAVLDKAQEYRSQKSIAKSCLVSSMTVSRVINQAASDVGQSSFDALPEHLMMDEFKSVKNVIGKMSFIYADAVSHRIVDVVADRKLKSLKDHFYRYSLKLRQKVKTVTIDMYEPYMSLIKQLFPNAKIIIDRFHIVQSLNRAELRRLLKENQIEKFNHKLFSIHLSDVCPKLRPVIRTLRRLATFIENTMTYSNLTNGPLEGINNKIKLIKRVSFGYRNYDNLRNRIIITSRLFVSTTKKEIKQLKVAYSQYLDSSVRFDVEPYK